MKMSNHQKRLWEDMIELIQSYLNNETKDFNALVGKLEGALDATDIKNIDLVDKWYSFWTPLEIWRATQENAIEKKTVEKDLLKMKSFLIEVQKNKIKF